MEIYSLLYCGSGLILRFLNLTVSFYLSWLVQAKKGEFPQFLASQHMALKLTKRGCAPHWKESITQQLLLLAGGLVLDDPPLLLTHL